MAEDQQRLLRRASARLLADTTLTKKVSLNVLAAGVDYGARILVGLFLISRLMVAAAVVNATLWERHARPGVQ